MVWGKDIVDRASEKNTEENEKNQIKKKRQSLEDVPPIEKDKK